MSLSRIKLALGISSTIIIVFFTLNLTFASRYLSSKQPEVLFFSIPIINLFLLFIWVGLGKISGIILLLFSIVGISFISIKYKFDFGLFNFLPFMASSYIGYRLDSKFYISNQKYNIESEHVEEETNLLKNQLDRNREELEFLERRQERFSNLSNLIEVFSSSLSKEKVIEDIVENAHKVIGKADRILFFLIDTKKQELNLTYSKKFIAPPHIKLKNGDIFDRWVFKKRQALLVEDINTDFRFSFERNEIDEGFSSIISTPLVSKEKVLGILRMDSSRKSFYTQEDLRLLDVISDLASAALVNAVLYERVSNLAVTDELTSLYVNKFFKERLSDETKRSVVTKTPFSIILLDIDNFKDYNDKYGHTAGDLVLKHIARILVKNLGGGDIAARYGGEEFTTILLGKNKIEATSFAEFLRKKIEEEPMALRREKTKITVSIGIATCPVDSTLSDEIISHADKRLYKAKEKGKNQVCAH